MIGSVLLLAGLATLAAAWVLLRRDGGAWRVGRLLAAAPRRSLAEASAIAAGGEERYVRLHGRVDSDEEFPGDDGKPLVYRRRRLQRRAGRGGWSTFDDERLAVPFCLQEKGERVTIDAEALGDGLVVVPRESEGVAADLTPGSVSGPLPDLPPETAVRLRIEQVSAVDHATAAGVPRQARDGSVVLGPGLGRPLVLTTLELDEAMRVLAAPWRRQLVLAVVLLATSGLLLLAGLALLLVAG